MNSQYTETRPVDVVIALDVPADQVRTIYRRYWELKHMYEFGQIYDEVEYDLQSLLILHKMFKDLGMKEYHIRKRVGTCQK